MAERSFAREVEDLKLGAGQEFRGEGILAITKALLQAGVGYVAGYQGAPISHLMDVFADAQDILEEMGIRFEHSASEATATATLAASIHYPIRGAAVFKSTVGLNVASDALANLASGGVKGGAVIILGEDYGEGSSIMQERSHAFAMKSQVWLVDPRPNLPSMVDMLERCFDFSEATNTPVMYMVRIRACHVHGRFIARDNRRPAMSLRTALENPQRDTQRIVLPPASYLHEQEKVRERLPRALDFIRQHRLNETFGPERGPVGIICQGGMYNTVIRSLQRLGLADLYGETQVPLHVLNVTYPLVDDELLAFCRGKQAVLMVEEGQPNHLEQQLGHLLHTHGLHGVRLLGKGPLPLAGELTGQVMLDGLRSFLKDHAVELLRTDDRVTNAPPAGPGDAELDAAVPARPAGFCTGCPERPIFAALKLTEQALGPHHIAADIGCHLFSILPPFNIGASTMGYGLGPASASAFNVKADKKPIAIIGDGGLWHNGLTSGVGNAVFNQQNGVILVVDNHYTAATGGQDILSSRARNRTRTTNHPITRAVRGMGVKWVRQVTWTYDVGRLQRLLTQALTSTEPGPKVIVASSECMLNKQRRIRPLLAKAIGAGKRVVRQRFGVDEDVCTGDHACMRLSGCPSLTLRQLDDPLRDDPVAHIDQSCVGCGNCGEVADAAALCPSFWRGDVVHNPSWWERRWAQLNDRWAAALRARHARRRLVFDSPGAGGGARPERPPAVAAPVPPAPALAPARAGATAAAGA